MSEPNATNVVAGSGLLYVAPLGTTLPTTGAHGEWPITWPMGWVACGYTDDGIDLVYTPSIKEIMVDEEAAPVDDVLATEKFAITAKLAEATLANLNNAIAASTYTAETAGDGVQTVAIGSETYYLHDGRCVGSGSGDELRSHRDCSESNREGRCQLEDST